MNPCPLLPAAASAAAGRSHPSSSDLLPAYGDRYGTTQVTPFSILHDRQPQTTRDEETT
jgi:hypothetical protein